MEEEPKETTTARPVKSTKSKRTHRLRYFVIGLILGALLLGAFRYVNVKNDDTHYHANFALYVNGQRDDFKSPTYYEEVQSCGGDTDNPRVRVHLHDEDAATVHVHDKGVTWGALFANLGYTLGDSVLKTSQGVFVDGQDGRKLVFDLNGEQVVDVANRVIRDQDVLLIDYGTTDKASLKKKFDAIPRTAKQHDQTADPSTCSGSEPLTWQRRLKAAVGLN